MRKALDDRESRGAEGYYAQQELKRVERRYTDENLRAIQTAVQELGTTRGAISAAADNLDISRRTLSRRLHNLPGCYEDYLQ